MSNSNILVVVQHNNHQFTPETLSVITAAYQLQDHLGEAAIDLLVMGYQSNSVVEILQSVSSIERILLVEQPEFEHPFAEVQAKVLAHHGKEYSHILAPATTFGKDIMPRAAALLDVGLLADIIKIESADTIVRPIYAGNALARVQSHDAIKMMTVRATAFEKVSLQGDGNAEVVTLGADVSGIRTQYIGLEATECERPDLASAEVVISGGRGVGSKENFALIENLADKLGGAIGASRAAVDAGFVTNDLQVGQTGKIVAPKLYIAIGISGAIQHLAGMKDSGIVVAINSDADAPIFEVADYGLVGDLFEILPELIDSV
ncbi:electron transfer flavoprotein subunit alpha/FixB family protein [Vibrio aquaticus]|uniref:Electron transfer flavoprotein subunit alpha n=1 Tax=Vibrio aquaticus TaxID=2496559 RepID=A0A3S0QF61_9VIBR|nr:FAD-binding protein [Vibrio aquaticus]RTZ17534.1 electron transfer flavoprotein subunit alpha/FixB family protein [Vibrio aquaticus]